jgi:DNA-binding MarR family transcriptional regulator
MGPERGRKAFAALLLAQVGAHGAKQFADRLSVLKLTPPHAGILRRLMQSPGISQRELATALGMHTSRLVAVLDEMESLGLLIREAKAEDRRTYSLQVTAKGRETMEQIAAISQQHNEALCAALNEEERAMLVGLLQRIADQQGLLRGVHPGFSTLGKK